jgi:hypothetical protein
VLSGDNDSSIDLIALAVNPIRTVASIVHFLVRAAPPSRADGADALVEIADDPRSISLI